MRTHSVLSFLDSTEKLERIFGDLATGWQIEVHLLVDELAMRTAEFWKK